MKGKNELVEPAMKIILEAGDARNYIQKAVAAFVADDLPTMENLLRQAEDAIREAHKAQIKVVQAEASGVQFDYSLLMSHAMDTLMTIMSELHMTKNMISIHRKDE